MESSDTLTPTTSSTVTSTTTTSSSGTSSNNQSQTYLLEISLISAQDLPQVSKSMRTYATAWIHPKRKLTSCIDQKGHSNPTWNDRFSFCVNDEFLFSENAAVTIEIYDTTSSWFKHVLVGTVRVLVSDLITTSALNNPRFVALQIRRPSGTFQGKLNMGVALMGPPQNFFKIEDNLEILKRNCDGFDENHELGDHHEKIHLWRSHSLGHDECDEDFPEDATRNGSIVNGSMCNGSALCSDVGPSASIVAAEIARKTLQQQQPAESVKWRRTREIEDFGSSIVEEMTMKEATAKGLTANVTRLKKEVPFPPPMSETDSDIMGQNKSKRIHMRRHSDAGLFSCFANAYGFQFTIVCGASNKPNFKENSRAPPKKRPSSSEATSAD